MSVPVLAPLVGAGALVFAAPYLAGLTESVPDASEPRWWRGRRTGRSRRLVTAGTAVVLGALAGCAAGMGAALPALLCLAMASTALCVIDVEHHRLPDRLVLTAALVGAVGLGYADLSTGSTAATARMVEGALVVFAALLALALAAPRSFGLGDVKLGAVLGGYLAWFGWAKVYLGILAGFVLGSLVAVVLLASRRATLKTGVPFGPMLVLGAFAVMAVHLPTAGWPA